MRKSTNAQCHAQYLLQRFKKLPVNNQIPNNWKYSNNLLFAICRIFNYLRLIPINQLFTIIWKFDHSRVKSFSSKKKTSLWKISSFTICYFLSFKAGIPHAILAEFPSALRRYVENGFNRVTFLNSFIFNKKRKDFSTWKERVDFSTWEERV